MVGGGDSALEEAIFLTKFADKVTVVHRRDQLRASKIMQDRAFANDKIDFLWNNVVDDVLGEHDRRGRRTSRDVADRRADDARRHRPVRRHRPRPNTDLFKGQLDMEDNGYLVTHDGTRTNVDGVFACGDVQDHIYRQAITAAGSGCMAAIDAERWLEANARSRACT